MTDIKTTKIDYQGQLLLATPKMTDFRFERAVILICSHNTEGAMGIIVNKPTQELKFDDILEQLKIIPQKKVTNHKIYFGDETNNNHHVLFDVSNSFINIGKENYENRIKYNISEGYSQYGLDNDDNKLVMILNIYTLI